MTITFIPDVNNTGSATLNINGRGARGISQLSIPSGSGAGFPIPLVANILVAGQPYTLLAYDGAANPFILQQPYTQVSVNTVANAQACPDTSVSANTITCSTVVSFSAYAAGQTVDVLLANTVTGATTINVDGLGAAAVTFNGTTTMATGQMVAGGTYRLQYDGTRFILQGSITPINSPAFTGSPTAPTQTTGDNTTKIATDAFVTTAVNNAVAGVNPAVAVQAATTAAANTSALTYNNGVAGVGATFTGANNTALTVDGFTFTALGQRLLVKNDTQSPSGAFNGIYYVTQVQASILPLILTRALDYDQPSDINNTGAIPVVNGTVNGTTSWLLTSAVNTIGTDPLTYVQFSAAPGSTVSIASAAFGTLTDGATVSWNAGGLLFANTSLTFTVHSGSRTLNVSGLVSGGNYVVKLIQDATGGEGLTLGTGCTWKVAGGGAGAVTLTNAAAALDALSFMYDGANCLATLLPNLN